MMYDSDVCVRGVVPAGAGDESEVKLHAGAVATVLKPGVQETQLIQCDVVRPFSTPPVLECILTFESRRITVCLLNIVSTTCSVHCRFMG